MQLRVMLDGVPVTEQDLTLAYRGDRPNGPALRQSSAGEHRDMSIDRESVALVSAGLVAHAGRRRRRANMAQALALGPRAPVEPPLV
jgi:hypothetical protein